MEPVDYTMWCPRDTAIEKSWRYCKDCEDRRVAKRCPYMCLYWKRKKRKEGDAPPPVETYERVCGNCGRKLSLQHALIHLLNASGYRKVGIKFEHKRETAVFGSCPYCFSGIGWYPGREEPEEFRSEEEIEEERRSKRIGGSLKRKEEKRERKARHARISRALRKSPEIKAEIVRFLEYEGADIGAKDAPATVDSGSGSPERQAKDLEWIFPEEDLELGEEDVPVDPGDDATTGFMDEVVESRKASAETLEESEVGELEPVEFTWQDDGDLGVEAARQPFGEKLSEKASPEPQYEGVKRCPEHPDRNATRSCPLCHREVCLGCMVFVAGLYACGECLKNKDIREMHGVPHDWESRTGFDLGPGKVEQRYKNFGLVKINHEGVPAGAFHRLFAHALDGAIALAILGALRWLFSGPLRFIIVSVASNIRFFENFRIPGLYATVPDNEVIARVLGFGWAIDLGLVPHVAWWVFGWPLLTWVFASLWPVFTSRSPGQRLVNLVVVDVAGRRVNHWFGLLRALITVPGILSLGILSLVNYLAGPFKRISFVDGITSTRVVTFSGNKAILRGEERIIQIAAREPADN